MYRRLFYIGQNVQRIILCEKINRKYRIQFFLFEVSNKLNSKN